MKRILFAVCLVVILAVIIVNVAAAYENARYLTNGEIIVETNDIPLISMLETLKNEKWTEVEKITVVKAHVYDHRDVIILHSSEVILLYPMDKKIRDKKRTIKYKSNDQYLPSVIAILQEVTKLKEKQLKNN